MGFASGVNKTVVISKETTWGVKPLATSGKYYPRKELSLSLGRASFKSERITSTAQVSDLRSGTDSATGTLNDEMSAGSHTDLWAALLRGPWTTGVSYAGTTISATGTTNKISRTTGSWITDGYMVGDMVVVSGFATSANNGRFIVKSLTALDLIVDATLTTEAAGASVTVAVGGSKLIIPSSPASRTDVSFTVEQQYTDIGSYRVATGVKVSQAAIKVGADAMGTVDFTLIGKDYQTSGTPYFNTIAAATTNSVLAGNKGTIYIDGTAVAVVTSLDLTINGNLEAGKTIGNLTASGTRPACAIFQGMFDVTGTMSAYFLDDALFNKFYNDQTASVVFRFIGDNNRELVMKLPTIRITSAAPSDSQTGGLTQTCAFTAILNQTPAVGAEASSIVIQEVLA